MGVTKKTYLDNMRVRISQIPPLDLKFNHSVLTEYELLVATIQKLNEIVDLTNLTLQEWYKIKTWIENELGNYAKEILNNMLKNGQLLINVDYETETETLSFIFSAVGENGV